MEDVKGTPLKHNGHGQIDEKIASPRKSEIRQARIMALFQNRGVVTNGVCCRENRVSRPTSYRDLQSLLKQGKIKTSGKKGPDAKYVPVVTKGERSEVCGKI